MPARAAVRIYADLDDNWDLVDALDVLAGAVGRCSGSADTELAGWMFGGAGSLRKVLAVRRPLTEQRDFDAAYTASRELDPGGFDLGVDVGRAATLRQIVDRALAEDGAR